MGDKDDVIAATSGVDSAIRRRLRPKRLFVKDMTSLSSQLLEQLGLPEDGSNVTVEVPTGELQIETFAPTVKVRAPDGTEVPTDEVAKALQKIAKSQEKIIFDVGKVRNWQVGHTIIGIIIFIVGIVSGNIDRLSDFVRWVRELLNVGQ